MSTQTSLFASQAPEWKVSVGDSREVLRTLPDNSVDSCVTDPPYELGFMNKAWDASGIAFDVGLWREVLRVLKPGGHLLAFSGTRTQHRMVCAIEDAGFDIRDQIGWAYGSGFPKSLDVSKAIDAAAGAEREVVGQRDTLKGAGGTGNNFLGESPRIVDITAPATPQAKQWQGWGTALKPAWEPICVARKPLVSTVAANVLQYGTGALNIDACRVEGEAPKRWDAPRGGIWSTDTIASGNLVDSSVGRWPANIIHDNSADVVRLFGEAAHFFYCPKASRAEREEGLAHLPAVRGWEAVDREEGSAGMDNPRAGAGRTASEIRNIHPTVKPVDLMRYLVTLVTPPGGLTLDPFAGSGSSGCGAIEAGIRFHGIELHEAHAQIARARIAYYASQFGGAA